MKWLVRQISKLVWKLKVFLESPNIDNMTCLLNRIWFPTNSIRTILTIDGQKLFKYAFNINEFNENENKYVEWPILVEYYTYFELNLVLSSSGSHIKFYDLLYILWIEPSTVIVRVTYKILRFIIHTLN